MTIPVIKEMNAIILIIGFGNLIDIDVKQRDTVPVKILNIRPSTQKIAHVRESRYSIQGFGARYTAWFTQ